MQNRKTAGDVTHSCNLLSKLVVAHCVCIPENMNVNNVKNLNLESEQLPQSSETNVG